MRLNSVIGILLLSANGGRAVHSQSAQLPIKESFCARCGFQVDSLGRIGEKHQLASSALGAAANRTTVVVAPLADGRSALIYDLQERSKSRIITPRISRETLGVSVAAGQVVLLHPSAITPLTKDSLLEAGSVPLPGSPSWAMHTNDDGWLVQMGSRTRSGIGFPLHLLKAGQTLRSFGNTTPQVRVGQPFDDYRVVTPSKDGQLWLAPVNEYRLEKWAPLGTLTSTLVRSVEWFRSWDGQLGRPDTARPKPLVAAIGQDNSGLLWVTVFVARDGWTRPTGPIPAKTTAAYNSRFRDSIIEVIDPDKGVVLFRKRFRGLMSHAGNGIWLRPGEAAGSPILDVFRFSLRR